MQYVIGIDLGTTSLKGIVFDKKGNQVASASKKYSIIHSSRGYSEQNPYDWIDACQYVMDKLFSKINDLNLGIEGISFSGQMHSLVLLDENNSPLQNAILWNDVRTSHECKEIMSKFGKDLLSITKNRALEGFTLPKIVWVKKNEPKLWEKVSKILLPKDYLRYELTGQLNMEYSDASGTLLMDLKQKEWSKEILDFFEISNKILPSLVKSTELVGVLKENIKEKYNIHKDVKVFAGGADNACSAIGAGIISEKNALASVGTSGVLLALTNEVHNIKNTSLHLFNHVINNHYYEMGVTLAAGSSLDWYRKTFYPDFSYEELLKETENISAGSEGLLFTPYIMGERSPHPDSMIRGSFIGIDSLHKRAHFTRSILEGITYSLKENYEIIKGERTETFDSIVLVGGGAKNKEWKQIQEDIFNCPVKSLQAEEGPATGAAMIAAVGLNWYANFEDCAQYFVKYTDLVYPIKNNVQIYNEYYEVYKDIYNQTKGLSSKIYHIQKK